MSKTLNVARYRNVPYTVNFFENGGGMKSYYWEGTRNKKMPNIKAIPQEVVEWLVINSQCFKDGELVIVEDSDNAKETVEMISDQEDYRNNTHTREEIESLLNGSINKMKAEFEKITSTTEKRFVIEIAKEIKVDSAAKQKFIAEWAGVPADVLFSEE